MAVANIFWLLPTVKVPPPLTVPALDGLAVTVRLAVEAELTTRNVLLDPVWLVPSLAVTTTLEQACSTARLPLQTPFTKLPEIVGVSVGGVANV